MRKPIFLINVLFIVFLLLCFTSCEDGIVQQENKEGENVNNNIKEEEWNSLKTQYLVFETTAAKDIFYLENVNGSQTISAYFIDKEDNKSVTSVKWSSSLPSDTVTVQTATTFSFNINSINELGDYWIAADSDGAKKIYSFTLTSKNLLSNSLSYSYLSLTDLSIKGLDFEKNIIEIANNAIEFDLAGMQIESDSERMLLKDTVSYQATGFNILLISLKEGAYLGKLNYEIVSGNVDFISMTGNNQIFVYCVDIQDPIVLSIKVGNQQTRQITIVKDETILESVVSPLIYSPVIAENSEGKIVTIVGDNVSNETFSLDRGSILGLSVQRRMLGSSDSFEDYDYLSNPLTDDVPYGKEIHLRHCGEYKICAVLINNVGVQSSIVEKYVQIEAYPAANPISVFFVEKEEIKSENRWEEFPETELLLNDRQRSNYYHVQIENPTGHELIVYSSCSEKDDIKSIYHQNIPDSFTVERNSVWTLDIHCIGTYSFKTSFLAKGSGYGLEYRQEIPEGEVYEIKESPAPGQRLLSIETDEQSSTLTLNSLYAPTNSKLYVAEYRNGGFYDSYEITGSKTISFSGSVDISFKAYLYSSDNHISGPVSYYFGQKTMQEVSQVINSDDKQKYENQRTIGIYVTRNPKGKYRDTFYSFDKENWLLIDKTSISGDDFYYFEPLNSKKRSATLYVKTEATDELATGNTIISKYIEIGQVSSSSAAAKIIYDRNTSYLGWLLLPGLTSCKPEMDFYVWSNNSKITVHYSVILNGSVLSTSKTTSLSSSNNVYHWSYGSTILVYLEPSLTGQVVYYCSQVGYLDSNKVSIFKSN